MTTRQVTVPPPIGGWNTRDSLDGMAPTDAVKLDNWIPGANKVYLRDGYASHSTGVGAGDVETLTEFHSGATRKLIACGGGGIYDATSSSASSIGTGFTEDIWDTENFSGRLFLVNGTDAPQDYDGTTLTATAWTGSGLTKEEMDGVNVFKNRLFFWDSSTADFWYAAIDAVTGTLTKFPLSRVTGFGGNIVSMSTWTVDSGSGIDDLAVFIMSSGDVVVYAGTDPGDASAWALQGIYRIGQPINKRAILKVGGDLMIATTDDYISLTAVLRSGHIGTASKLSGAMRLASANKSLPGWQGVLSPKHGLMVWNVPNSDNTFDQHVISTINGGPCKFTDIPSVCWAVYNDDLYFGAGSGVVYKYTGENDNTADINGDAIQAWNSFQIPNRKRVAATRHVLSSEASTLDYETDVGFDFQTINTPSSGTTTGGGDAWDVSAWDTSSWGADKTINTSWRVASGSGQSISTRLRVSSQVSISWLRTDFRMEVGANF